MHTYVIYTFVIIQAFIIEVGMCGGLRYLRCDGFTAWVMLQDHGTEYIFVLSDILLV